MITSKTKISHLQRLVLNDKSRSFKAIFLKYDWETTDERIFVQQETQIQYLTKHVLYSN